MRPAIYTLGTSNRSFEEFVALLLEHFIKAVVDVRSFPTSRYPHFSMNPLRHSLESKGFQYHFLGKELGGYRKGGYQAHMETELFNRGLQRLEEIAIERITAFFCSERFPWRCHRRYIAEKLEGKGWRVIHIIDPGKIWIPGKENVDNVT